jgi:hypothetical protein
MQHGTILESLVAFAAVGEGTGAIPELRKAHECAVCRDVHGRAPPHIFLRSKS